MSDFDNYIKETYPQDYENLKLNYPDVGPSEFYPEAEDAWNHQQQKIDEYAMVAESLDESYVRECKKNKELQKRIDDALSALESDAIGFSGLVHNYNKAEKILKGETHES